MGIPEAFGQGKAKLDVVYLKDGGMVRGHITEYILDKHLIIQSLSGETYTFKPHEIDRREREVIKSGKNKELREIQIKDKGYYNVTQFGLLISSGSNSETSPRLTTINGMRINRYVQVGLGASADFYYDFNLFPVFLDVRGDVLKGQITPQYYIQGGYALTGTTVQNDWGWATKSKGGLMIGGGLGMKINTRSTVGFLLTVGYQHQRAERQSGWDDGDGNINWDTIDKLGFNRLSIGFGISI